MEYDVFVALPPMRMSVSGEGKSDAGKGALALLRLPRTRALSAAVSCCLCKGLDNLADTSLNLIWGRRKGEGQFELFKLSNSDFSSSLLSELFSSLPFHAVM